jgi:mannose-1-phosphate guanylyltransferase
MRAMLLAAGLGTRLRPLTLDTPKCLMPIQGVPLLELWINKLFAAGVKSLLINTHYLATQVEQLVFSSKFKHQIQCVYEPVLLGTAGTLIKNIDFFCNEDGILLHADNYFDGELKTIISAHKNRPVRTLMTMMTFRTDEPKQCGIVEVNKENIIYEFHEKKENPPGNLANGALYIMSDELLKFIEDKHINATDFSTEIIPYLMGKIYNYTTSATYIDIGTLENYSKVK